MGQHWRQALAAPPCGRGVLLVLAALAVLALLVVI